MSEVAVVPAGSARSLEVLGVDVRFLCTGAQTGGAWSLMENIVPPGAGPPPHHHAWAEAYYIVSGAIDFTIEGQSRRVSAGDFIYAPGGTVHGFSGASEEPARMLIFDAPAHMQGFFEEVDREVRSMPDDLPKLLGLGTKHGILFETPAPALANA